MEFTPEVRIATDPIYQKISKVMPEIEWSVHAPYIHRINQLKKEKNELYLLTIIKLQKFITVLQMLQQTR